MFFRIFTLITVLTLIARTSNGQVPLSDFFRFGIENGDTDLRPLANNLDDGSSPLISLKNQFKFFDETISSLFVNINGCVSFREAIPDGRPVCSPLKYEMSMIAPFWADADLETTSSPGGIFYRQTRDKIELDKALFDIKRALPNMEFLNKLDWAFIATWYKVGFHSQDRTYTTKSNSFQMAMVTGGLYSFIIFNYNDITWTTGASTTGGGNKDGLGGYPARAGYDNGQGKYLNLPGSCRNDIINITKMKLENVPGKFVFRVDNEIVPTRPTTVKVSTETHRPSTFSPSSSTTNSPSHIPSTTYIPDEINDRKIKLEQKLNELRIRVKSICTRLANRIALESQCNTELANVKRLLVELPLVKHDHELKIVEEFYRGIAEDIDEIEKDISI